MRINKTKIGSTLMEFGHEMQGRTDVLSENERTINLEKMMATPEAQKTITKLKTLGVKDRTHLINIGFVAAGMLLNF